MIDELCNWVRARAPLCVPILLALVMLDVGLWWWIIAGAHEARALSLHFLNVGQGDAELVVFPGGHTLLIDGGPPNGHLLQALAAVLPPTARAIDVVALTHAQSDHFSGIIEVLARYRVGVFVWTGRVGSGEAHDALMQALKDRHVPLVTLRRGDAMRSGAGVARVLAPDARLAMSKDLNDTSLVLETEFASTTALFTGDIAKGAERMLAGTFSDSVDILKVPHHGSRTALVDAFLQAAHPALAVIEVGKNSYGHPAPEALASIARVGARMFRTDKDGTVSIRITADGVAHITRHPL